MRVEEFGVSENCMHELKRVGFTSVEEIVIFLEQQAKGRAMIEAGWLKCFDEIVNQLKLCDFWSPELEDAWPSI